MYIPFLLELQIYLLKVKFPKLMCAWVAWCFGILYVLFFLILETIQTGTPGWNITIASVWIRCVSNVVSSIRKLPQHREQGIVLWVMISSLSFYRQWPDQDTARTNRISADNWKVIFKLTTPFQLVICLLTLLSWHWNSRSDHLSFPKCQNCGLYFLFRRKGSCHWTPRHWSDSGWWLETSCQTVTSYRTRLVDCERTSQWEQLFRSPASGGQVQASARTLRPHASSS